MLLSSVTALASSVTEKPSTVVPGLHASVISIQHEGEKASGRLLITNQSKQTVDLTNALVEFTTPYRVVQVTGSFFPISKPDRRVLVSERVGGQYNNQLVLAYSDSQILQTELHSGSTLSLMLIFESQAKLGQSSAKATIVLSDKDKQVSYQYGQLVLEAPAAPASEVSRLPAIVTVKGVGKLEKRLAVDWGQKFILDQLPYGKYTIHTEQVGNFPGAVKQTVVLSKKQPSAALKIKYDNPVYTTVMQLVAPASVDENKSLMAYVQNVTLGEHPKLLQLEWGKAQQLNNLTVGHRYRLWFNHIKRWPYQFEPNASSDKPFEFTAAKDAIQQFVVTYQQSRQSAGELAVATQVTGLPIGAKATITLQPVAGGAPVTQKLSSGQDTLTNIKPGSYWLAASDYVYQGKVYRATLSPVKLTLDHNQSARINVDYTENDKLVFAGREWRIKKGLFDGGRWMPENVFVDQQGQLHLVLDYQNGQWQAAGVESVKHIKPGSLHIKTIAQADNTLSNALLSVGLLDQEKMSGLGFTMTSQVSGKDTAKGIVTRYWLKQGAKSDSKQSMFYWQANQLTHSIDWGQNSALFELRKGHGKKGVLTFSRQYLSTRLKNMNSLSSLPPLPLLLSLTPKLEGNNENNKKHRKVELIINSINTIPFANN